MNKGKLFSIIGTAVAAVLIAIVVFAIGFAYAKINGEKVSDPLTLATKHLGDALKAEKEAKLHTLTTLVTMWSLGFALTVLALIFALVRIATDGGIDFIMKIVVIALVAAGLIFTLAGTANYYSEAMKPLKDLPSELRVNPFDKGMLAANFILTIIGGGAGVALSGLAFSSKFN